MIWSTRIWTWCSEMPFLRLSLGRFLNDSNLITKEYKEVLMYEVGYLVALAIGLLFIILMTLVGLFFPCCRCCGNCGGKMYQKQTKRMTCKRR
ncbi:unnamed protein product, partial [Staurois parvus]